MRLPIDKFMQEHPELLDSGSIWQAFTYSIDLMPPRNENVRLVGHSGACQVIHLEG